jgi:adenine phosphoribosyltransferase
VSGASAEACRALLLTRFRWIDGHADVAGLFAEADALAVLVGALAEPFSAAGVTKVAAVEARGFVVGAPVALALGAGFVAIRKPGSIHPGAKIESETAPDWRGRRIALRLQRASLGPGDRVLVVDDWAETGSQASAAFELVRGCGAEYVGLSLLVDQLDDDARAYLAPVRAVVRAEELPPGGSRSAAPADD